MDPSIHWLVESAEPWTRYRTLIDLLDRPVDDPARLQARSEMLAHPQVQTLIATAQTWGERPLKRHNDASHPLYAFSTLADFGVQVEDRGMGAAVDAVLAGDFAEVGDLMTRNMEQQRLLHPALVSDRAKEVASIATDFAVLGVKVNGAGGDGGSLTLLCNEDMAQKRQMLSALKSAGYCHVPTCLARDGLRVW